MIKRRKPLDLTQPDPVVLPPGYSIRPMATDADLAQFQQAVKVVFNFQDRPDVYRLVQTAPSFVPELELLALDDQDRLAAFCTVWVDWDNGLAEFEPVGTLPEQQKKGLAQALMAEGCNRLRRLGVPLATVESWSESVGANKLYDRAGYQPWTRLFNWSEPKG